ncbi:MAG: GTPase HflX [Elusimicrobiota bacterium]
MERVILVGIEKKWPVDGTRGAQDDGEGIEELRRLTETAGGRVTDTLAQRLTRYNPRSLIGSGKIDEVRRAARANDAGTIIFDENLTPAQQLHLERELEAKVVDRTRLILDIFAQRARTKEGELQVELAQLSYMLPRLTGSWRAFSQQAGGIGTRGPGERKLEYERRHIQRRIAHLKDEIKRMARDRATQRNRRTSIPVPSVAIIGYTNAGKSSLLNRLTGSSKAGGGPASVYADDKLFATLDPTTRRIRLPAGGWAVFTDTVGFISKLPPQLIAAFRSTLEEVSRADCILHLEDGASTSIERQRKVVDEVLETLDARNIPRVVAVNKKDLLNPDQHLRLRARNAERLFVSALTGDSIEEMLSRVQDMLNKRWILRELTIAPKNAGRLADIYRSAQVIGQTTRGDRILLRMRVTPENWSRLVAKFKGNSVEKD